MPTTLVGMDEEVPRPFSIPRAPLLGPPAAAVSLSAPIAVQPTWPWPLERAPSIDKRFAADSASCGFTQPDRDATIRCLLSQPRLDEAIVALGKLASGGEWAAYSAIGYLVSRSRLGGLSLMDVQSLQLSSLSLDVVIASYEMDGNFDAAWSVGKLERPDPDPVIACRRSIRNAEQGVSASVALANLGVLKRNMRDHECWEEASNAACGDALRSVSKESDTQDAEHLVTGACAEFMAKNARDAALLFTIVAYKCWAHGANFFWNDWEQVARAATLALEFDGAEAIAENALSNAVYLSDCSVTATTLFVRDADVVRRWPGCSTDCSRRIDELLRFDATCGKARAAATANGR